MAAVASCIPRADPLASVRRWEAQHGRVLVDPSLAAWRDMDSEAVVLARQRWRVRLPRGTAYWSRRRYLSFDERGRPERLIDLRLLSAHQDVISTRHTDLLKARAGSPMATARAQVACMSPWGASQEDWLWT